MEGFVVSTLGVLVLISVGFHWIASHTKSRVIASSNPEFQRLQRIYFAPYLLAVFSDWLQGPYVYRLYSQYGYKPADIALLYVVGFAASVLFGTCTGPLADRFGRKRLCMVFCGLYAFCCLTKLSPNFWWLVTGRVFGGISTSILFSTFESWYVCQHMEHYSFPAEWISNTFTITTFWNGVLAILAGIAADIGAEWLNFGAVAPFMTAVPCLIAAGFFISMYWAENFGGKQHNLTRSCIEGLQVIFRTPVILLLGIVQSMFESIMYIFVFLWTPILDSSGSRWPLGLVFSCFMVCIMIGSSLYAMLLSRNVNSPSVLFLAVSCSMVAVTVCSWSTSDPKTYPIVSFVAFLLLEIAIGMYFPSIGYLRSQVIPESLRANIMNWFRVPMNIITCSVLLWLHHGEDSNVKTADSNGNQTVFLFSAAMSLVGLAAAIMFKRRYVEKTSTSETLTEASSI